LAEAKDEATRTRVLKESQEQQQYISDSSVAQLAAAYERGAVLSFYFAEQLRGMETAGFDIAGFVSDMIASIDPARELRRPEEFAAIVKRYTEARKRLQEERARAAEMAEAPQDERRAALFKSLTDVDALLRVNNYTEAESRLQTLRQQYAEEPRVYFALGQAASLSAQDAFDETLQAERLNRALNHFQQAVLLASRDTEGPLLSRAHVARGRILAFLERKAEAAKEFDAAIALGELKGGAYREALNEKNKLAGQP
jgi:tetratricopeptide (TPR) repeat protein